MDSDTFAFFPKLPTELRLEIWRLALSVPTVWSPVRSEKTIYQRGGDYWVTQIPGFIGPSPHRAGYACREAREVLEKTHLFIPLYCVPPSMNIGRNGFRPIKNLPRDTDGGSWVNPETTFIYLGPPSDLASIHYHYFRGSFPWSQFRHFILCQSDVRIPPTGAGKGDLILEDLCPYPDSLFLVNGWTGDMMEESRVYDESDGSTETYRIAKCDPAERYLQLSQEHETDIQGDVSRIAMDYLSLRMNIVDFYMSAAAVHELRTSDSDQSLDSGSSASAPHHDQNATSHTSSKRPSAVKLPKVYFLENDGTQAIFEAEDPGLGSESGSVPGVHS